MKWKRWIIGLAGAGTLMSCGTAPQLTHPAAALQAAATAPPVMATPAAKPAVELTVGVEPEPNDYAHRNFCAEGAIAVLLSTWTSAVPTIDDIGVAAHVVESRGTRGADAMQAINNYLEQITGRTRYSYSESYVTSLDVLKSDLERDLSGQGRFVSAGHGSPVLVRVRTASLPGWNGWQAGHVVAVFGYDFTAGNPSGDTVTYAESASPVAAYEGPQVQTISLADLWAAVPTALPSARAPATTATFPRDLWTVIA